MSGTDKPLKLCDAFGAGPYGLTNASAPTCARLLRNVTVRRRIGELQRQAVESTDITVASLLAEAAAIQRAAMQNNNQSAAVAAFSESKDRRLVGREDRKREHQFALCKLPSEEQWEAERVERTDHPMQNRMVDGAKN